MADEQTHEVASKEAVSEQGRRMVMQLDESGHAPHYANAFQIQSGKLEVVFDFGYRTAAGRVNVPTRDGGQEQADRLRFVISNRVAMPYPVAKQLCEVLQNSLAKAEARHGGEPSSQAESSSTSDDS